jgi:hypothetical protein
VVPARQKEQEEQQYLQRPKRNEYVGESVAKQRSEVEEEERRAVEQEERSHREGVFKQIDSGRMPKSAPVRPISTSRTNTTSAFSFSSALSSPSPPATTQDGTQHPNFASSAGTGSGHRNHNQVRPATTGNPGFRTKSSLRAVGHL